MSIIKTVNFESMVNFEHHSSENHLVCKFSGRLDTLNCISLSEEIQNKLQELKQGQGEKDKTGEKIDFDMTEVTYISSAFIRICLLIFNQCQKGNFAIINCDPFLKKTFKIAGLDDLLRVS
jgi:anti-anti-sigma factor